MRGRAGVLELQAPRYSARRASRQPTLLPEGWLESGGFVLSAETMADFEALDLDAHPPHGLQRALLLDRDGIAADEGMRTRLAEAGADVTLAPGPGWGAMVGHPERAEPRRGPQEGGGVARPGDRAGHGRAAPRARGRRQP